VTDYSLFGNVSCNKTYPGIFNISVNTSIAHQSIDIMKFSVCHFHYVANVHLKNFWAKILQLQPASPVCVNNCCVPTYTKSSSPQLDKKLNKLDNVKIGHTQVNYYNLAISQQGCYNLAITMLLVDNLVTSLYELMGT